MEYIAKKAVSALGDLLYTIKQVEALLLRFLAPSRPSLLCADGAVKNLLTAAFMWLVCLIVHPPYLSHHVYLTEM